MDHFLLEEVVTSTIIMHSKTRSGKSLKKDAFVSVISKVTFRKKRLKKLYEVEEEEKE